MSQIFALLVTALNSTPTAVIPFLITLALIGYLSFKIYQEFRKVYQKINTVNVELTNRIAKVEQELSLTDSKTIMLSAKLERIEESLNKMNDTLIELATTLKMIRETKTK